MGDPVLHIRCPKWRDDRRPHLAVDVHQPLTPAKLAAIMGVVAVCSCGAETAIVPAGEAHRG